jgi:hypothetical protein
MMEFKELKEQVKGIGFDELRREQDDYFEAVIIKPRVEELVSALKKFFGTPAWPSKRPFRNKLPLEIEEAIRDFGGIMPGQTLYLRNHECRTIFAMLWPWQDGWHTTVKIFSNNKPLSEYSSVKMEGSNGNQKARQEAL